MANERKPFWDTRSMLIIGILLVVMGAIVFFFFPNAPH